MLSNVAIAVSRADRQRTLREPNALDCVLFNKQVTRTSEGASYDGYPTMGGLGVMTDEDEVSYEWVEAGDARICFSQGYAAPLGNTSDDGQRLDYADGVLAASIATILEPGAPGYVQPDKRMLVAVLVGGGVIINYEIVGVTGEINIPPYTRKYLLNPRPDEEASASAAG